MNYLTERRSSSSYALITEKLHIKNIPLFSRCGMPMHLSTV